MRPMCTPASGVMPRRRMCNAAAVGLIGTYTHPDVIDALRPVLPDLRIDALPTSSLKPECRRESSPAIVDALGRGWRRGR
jgi:hypothetical protein